MQGKVIDVTLDTLVGEVMNMKNDGQRLVTYSTYQVGEKGIGILYHFDKNLEITHLRLETDMDKPIPSVSGVFFAALLVENEIRDQWDVKFDGLVLDFNRTLYLDPEVTQVPLVSNVKIEPKK
ncbi:MAG: NADH-quinone oxidoreductase subunit C [Pseudodesulfovibrio sp.]|jgi:Ni,Fe-hydrogenase III component G|uniref:Ech hydrogenase subunit D n=1 Tax=Pseudodesulfovibrio indicus TaxID=1716143 RepID=A0A126QRH2_9BACT|nr:NADH-quinone oxidoreductase subunit C [Pseudodesulfovibrio indicus]AMK12663.1 NADH dehydrogenase [Pseudodesulfovibrio indicus]TDT90978.1 ech hydrogenase subunit D [Pseudodesulfovibrio indicus]